MTGQLVLSLFPGIGLLDMAFEEEGFCIVRGPDLLWGGDIKRFHPPAGKFDGVIGGPPCKGESGLAHLNGTPGKTMAPEFWRVVEDAACAWWIMEAVIRHDAPHVLPLSPRHLGEEQSRLRYFHSNLPIHRFVETDIFNEKPFKHAVVAGHGPGVGKITNGIAKYPWSEHCRLQGLSPDFDLPGFKVQAKYEAVGNGVPIAMGRAVAKAVKRAIGAAKADAA